MSSERTRDRGNLFENKEKQKPSHPDFHGDCSIDGTPYELRGWRRDDQLTLSLAPPRGDRNTYPPDVFRGALEAIPVKRKGKGGAAADAPPTPAWEGTITSTEAAYTIRAFEKQGKSGMYYTLQFERTEKPAEDDRRPSWESTEFED